MPIILDGNGIIKNINFQHPSASATNLSLNSDGTIGGAIPYPNRNLLYNGAMQVSQRGTSTAGITSGGSGYFTADRWNATYTNLGTFTQSIENDAPTGSGFRRSLKMLCTTANASPAAGNYMVIQQVLEGQDVQRVLKGTSSAQQLTLSFWVKSNVTGTYIAELQDLDNSRKISASYTISASATWERKTITFIADTTGAFDNDNGASLEVNFWLGAGSTWTGGSPLQTTWGTGSNTRATGQTNLAAATNNYWQITGVQLETGSIATPFEFKNYGQELRECQRYYEICNIFLAYISYKGGIVYFNVEKRTTPNSVIFYSGANRTGTAGQLTEANTSGTGYNVTSHEAHPRSIMSIATSFSGTTNFAGSVAVAAEL